MQKNQLLDLLNEHGVPLEQWGKGEAKTVEHLLAELRSKEAVLVRKKGRLVRCTGTAAVNVFHVDAKTGATLKLCEDRQVFADMRYRQRNLSSSISEKLGERENPFHGAIRAFQEELHIFDTTLELKFKGFHIKETLSLGSFPGLPASNTIWVFDSFLPERLYEPGGYNEHQADKSSFFRWHDVTAEFAKYGRPS